MAEEARNVNVEIEQCCYTDEVQKQEVGLTRPAFVTEYSLSVLNVGATIAPDVLDEDGNMRRADIGSIWAGNETFLHGVRVGGSGSTTTIGDRTGDVDAVSVDEGPRHGEYVHVDTTADAVDTADSPGCGDSTAPSTAGDTSGVSTGRPHSTLQQKVPKLSGVV